MGKVSKIGTVNVKSFMEVHKYSHVMHLVSLLEGQKRTDMDIFQALMSFFYLQVHYQGLPRLEPWKS